MINSSKTRKPRSLPVSRTQHWYSDYRLDSLVTVLVGSPLSSFPSSPRHSFGIGSESLRLGIGSERRSVPLVKRNRGVCPPFSGSCS